MHATVLLATFNGGSFLDEQIASLAAQDVDRLDVHVGDDGSTDATLALLARWASRWRKGRFVVERGPGTGFAENFRSLVAAELPEPSDGVAFCDQDDIWGPDKLTVALRALGAYGSRPAVYASRSQLIDAAGRPIGYTRAPRRPPSFGNALVESIASGNTMVLNPAAHRLIAASARRTGFLYHDWWTYLLVSGAGGVLHHDPASHIRYRQHGGNQLGSDRRLAARLKRLRGQFGGDLRRWNDANLTSLAAVRDLLTPSAQQLLDELCDIRQHRGPMAVRRLAASGIRRQTWRGNASLALAAWLGRL